MAKLEREGASRPLMRDAYPLSSLVQMILTLGDYGAG